MGTADVTSPAPQVLLAHVATVLSRGALWTDTIEELLATIGASWECSAVSLDIDFRNEGKFDDVEQLWGSWTWGGGSTAGPMLDAPVTIDGVNRGSLRIWHRPDTDGRDVVDGVGALAAILAIAIARDACIIHSRNLERLYESHIEGIPAITYIENHDPDAPGGYGEVFVSPQIESMLGYTPQTWLADGGHWQRAIHPDDYQRIADEGERTTVTGEPFVEEYRVITAGGVWKWVRDQSRLVYDEQGTPSYWHGVITDVTERKGIEEQVAFLAYHDVLTGLANRGLLEETARTSLARAARNGTGVAVLFLDLDGFKSINDDLGHAAGDDVLRAVAERLLAATRDTDLVSRVGGDEFVLLLSDIPTGPMPEFGADGLVAVMADRIQEALSAPIPVDGRGVRIGTSIGSSIYPLDAEDLDGLLKKADIDMYAQKTKRASWELAQAAVG